jgi:iron complex transport system substrate-binding protein
MPQRIASIAPSNTEIAFALGLGPRVVAVDQYSNYPPEATQKAQVGSYIEPDLEALVAADPDLVLATGAHVKTLLPAPEARKLPVLVLEPKDLEGVFGSLLLVGRATGQTRQADELVGQLRQRVATLTSALAGAPKSRVFFELGPELYTAGPGAFVSDLIDRAGGENIAADADTPWPQLSQEVVIQRDPAVIILVDEVAGVTPESVRARPGWDQVSAVKEGRIVTLDPDLTNRPGPRAVDGLEAIARALHPDRVK